MQNRIKEHREKCGMTQADLADAIGTTTQQISRLERSQRRLSDKWLTPLSGALRVRKADLLVGGFIPPSGAPRDSDLAKDEAERRLLKFWGALSPDAQDFILTMVDAWAERFLDDGE